LAAHAAADNLTTGTLMNDENEHRRKKRQSIGGAVKVGTTRFFPTVRAERVGGCSASRSTWLRATTVRVR